MWLLPRCSPQPSGANSEPLCSPSPPAQQTAAEALAIGATHTEAAEAADVARETVTRWLGHHPGFRAALDLYRATLATEQADRARRIRGKALDVLGHEVGDAGLLAMKTSGVVEIAVFTNRRSSWVTVTLV